MLRRVVLRARRRVPARTAGHDSSELDGPADAGAGSLDVYHVSRGGDGLLAAKARREDLEGLALSLDALPRLRARAKRHILNVRREERSAGAAWERLQRLYAVFQRLEQERAALALAASKPRDEGLRSLLAQHMCPPGVVLRDLEAITQALPQGFTPQMFVSLGDALYAEMVAASQTSTIDRDAFAALGDQLYAHAISAAA